MGRQEGDVFRLPFGKYQNEPIQSVPESYLRWLLQNVKLQNGLAETVTEEIERRCAEAGIDSGLADRGTTEAIVVPPKQVQFSDAASGPCAHPRTEFARVISANGFTQVMERCRDCGENMRKGAPWVSRRELGGRRIGDLPLASDNRQQSAEPRQGGLFDAVDSGDEQRRQQRR